MPPTWFQAALAASAAMLSPIASFASSQSDIDGYNFEGEGICIDSQDRYYASLWLDNFTTVEDCADECQAKYSSDDYFVGIHFTPEIGYDDYYFDDDTTWGPYCECLFSDGKTPNNQYDDDYNYYSSYGTGQIAGVFFSHGELCYSFDESTPPTEAPTPGPPSIDGYELIGIGTCLDSQYRSYVYNWTTLDTIEECAEHCETEFSSDDYFVGFNFSPLYGPYCDCLFSGGSIPGYDDDYYNDYYGIGKIATVSAGSGFICYSYIEATPPTSAPTISSSPSTSTPPTWDWNWDDDWSFPTYSPTPFGQTRAPTPEPPLIDGFELIGRGICVDSQSRFYSYNISSTDTVEDCADYCETKFSSDDYFVGINFTPHDRYYGAYCECLFSGGKLPGYDYDDDYYNSYYGTGKIADVYDGYYDVLCYSFIEAAPPTFAPTISSSPTTSPPPTWDWDWDDDWKYPTYSPTPFGQTRAPTPAPPPIDGYELIGRGICLDSKFYPYAYDTVILDTVEDCADHCEVEYSSNDYFVGINFTPRSYYYGPYCDCLFSGGEFPSSDDDYYNGYYGNGKIAGVYDTDSNICYSYIEATPPTSSPTVYSAAYPNDDGKERLDQFDSALGGNRPQID